MGIIIPQYFQHRVVHGAIFGFLPFRIKCLAHFSYHRGPHVKPRAGPPLTSCNPPPLPVTLACRDHLRSCTRPYLPSFLPVFGAPPCPNLLPRQRQKTILDKIPAGGSQKTYSNAHVDNTRPKDKKDREPENEKEKTNRVDGGRRR